MAAGRHRAERTKNPAALRAVAITAPAVTAGVVGIGLIATGTVGAAPEASGAEVSATSITDMARVAAPVADSAERTQGLRISRSAQRMTAAAVAMGKPERKKLVRYATDSLDVRVQPRSRTTVVEELEPGTQLTFTGRTEGDYAEVSYKGAFRWVTASYLSADKPATPETMGISGAPCASGSAVEGGLTSAAVRVHRAVCANFPEISRYIGRQPRGEHSSGKAIDIMISDAAVGEKIADFLKAHAGELDLFDVIYRQRIWTPVRSGEGWRHMPDRGSATANHYDHVHVMVN